jgi:hypothetical protein
MLTEKSKRMEYAEDGLWYNVTFDGGEVEGIVAGEGVDNPVGGEAGSGGGGGRH